MDKILDFTTQLALETGNLLRTYYQTQGIRVKLKSDQTVVTEADLAANQLIQKTIRAEFPADGILSEEGNTIYPRDNPYVWIIDPLDGTTNFSLGLHYWGVSIARLKDGFPDLAVLFFPIIEELFTAVKGGGAYLNGNPLLVVPPDLSNPNTFFSCCSRAHRNYTINIEYKTRILGSAAYSLASISRSSAILAFEVTPKVWDFSGSWLVTQEAGGTIGPISGNSPFPLIPGIDYSTKSYATLAGVTPEIWTRGQERIIKK